MFQIHCLGMRMPVTWPFLNPISAANGPTQAALAANLLNHQPPTTPVAPPTAAPANHMSPATQAAILMAHRNAAQRRRYLGE